MGRADDADVLHSPFVFAIWQERHSAVALCRSTVRLVLAFAQTHQTRAVSFGLFIASLLHFPDLSLEWGKVCPLARSASLLTPQTEVRLFVSLASSVFALDWLITLSIILMLWRRRSGQPAQDRLVKRLVLLSAETQLPSSLFAMVICITDATGYLFLSPIFEA